MNLSVSERGEWLRWLLGGIVTLAMMTGAAALGRAMVHETRITSTEEKVRALEEADRLIRADLARDHDENRKDMAEIKADIKKLLERSR